MDSLITIPFYVIDHGISSFLDLLDLPERKVLRHHEVSKEELIEMIKEMMSKEEQVNKYKNTKRFSTFNQFFAPK